MKIIKVLSSTFLLIFSQSCGVLPIERQGKILHEIRNQSDHVLEINAFNKGIAAGSIRLMSKETIELGAGYTNSGPYTIFGSLDPQSVDSVVLSFDSQRFIIQYCDGNPLIMANRGEVCPFVEKNIMVFYNKTNIDKKVNKEYIAYKYVYIIDNNDFQKAVEL